MMTNRQIQSQEYYRKWNLMMAENFERVARGCRARGYPESEIYFKEMSRRYKEAGTKLHMA